MLDRHPDLGNGAKFPRQLAMLGLSTTSAVALVLALPVSDSTRNQVIGLIGVLISGVLAFASTNILSNLMAGVMLHMTRSFHTGDFIRVADHFGRVAERGLFDTEIQTEHRELVSLPNSFIATHPVTVVRSSGAIVSATLSLGYDVHHARVKPLLLEAALASGLEDPFVHTLELGNFAITYRVSGLLTEVKTLLTARSRLHEAVLDTLHHAGIEIMSPTFMNQRRVPDEATILPKDPVSTSPQPAPEEAEAESVVFDKAEEAARTSLTRKTLKEQLAELEAEKSDTKGDAREALTQRITALREELSQLDKGDTDVDTDASTKACTDGPAAPAIKGAVRPPRQGA
jgi:hypothetical protein